MRLRKATPRLCRHSAVEDIANYPRPIAPCSCDILPSLCHLLNWKFLEQPGSVANLLDACQANRRQECFFQDRESVCLVSYVRSSTHWPATHWPATHLSIERESIHSIVSIVPGIDLARAGDLCRRQHKCRKHPIHRISNSIFRRLRS